MWWLNPPAANAADLDSLVEMLTTSGLKLEVLKETAAADEDAAVEYSILDIGLLSDISPFIVQQYGVGTTNLEIFDRIAAKLPLGTDYVYFRDSQYVYSFVFGDLSYSGTSFSGSGCTRIDYNTYTGSSQQPTFTVSNVSSFSLGVGNYLVYSNLGNYPMLGGAQGAYRFMALSQAFMLLCSMFFVLWGFARLRIRR